MIMCTPDLPPLVSSLNEEQRLAVTHPTGSPAVLIAGAGSGKTKCLQSRVVWLIEQGVPPPKICCVTFTNRAAGEIARRVIEAIPGIENGPMPRMSTIHSLALSGIRKNPEGFGLQDKVTPLDDYDQKQMMKKIIGRRKFEEDTTSLMFRVLDRISFHRARGVGFRKEYTDDVHEQALKTHAGYHAMDEVELDLWEEFEREKLAADVVDFDDMLHYAVRRMRTDERWLAVLHKQFDHVLMDEGQDTNPVQWEFINGLLHPEKKDMYVVGDMNQCQPPGTKVTILDHPIRTRGPGNGRGFVSATYKTVAIEGLVGDVISWTKVDQRTYSIPRKVSVFSRIYKGSLLTIKAENGASTRVTPNHWLWVRFNKNTHNKYIVYLMYKLGYGYRVGISRFKKGCMSRNGFGLSSRLSCERGNKAWILRVCDSRREAEAWEEITSVKYGIPESVFNAGHACRNKTQDFIKLVFSHANPANAERCLTDYGLFADIPLVERFDSASVNQCNRKWRGYFKTIAANIVPIAPLLDIPVQGVNKFTSLSSVSVERYEGLVYSLDVEKDHTYIADGLVVGNSIYGFNGAVPEIMRKYSEDWRGVRPALYKIQRNHRSAPEIVDFANLICKKMTRTIPIQMVSWRGMNNEHGEVRKMVLAFPQSVAAAIAQEIARDSRHGVLAYKDNALLVRAGIQIRDLESELIRRHIPYIVRGGRGLLAAEEIRDIMAYMRLAANHKDFMALVRAAGAPKCGVGEATLEKIRQQANEKYDGDLIQAAREQRKLGMFCDTIEHVSLFKDSPIAAVEKVVAMSNYKEYVRQKYKKEPGRVQSKLENIERFNMMIIVLVQDGNMSLDDLIFNLTLDRPKGDEAEEREAVLKAYDEGKITKDELDAKIKVLDQGSVVITTIHQAKGLEWNRVYLVGVVDGVLPHRFCLGEESSIEEERRLWYVAVTRARNQLVICVYDKELRGQNMQKVSPSRFLAEIGA